LLLSVYFHQQTGDSRRDEKDMQPPSPQENDADIARQNRWNIDHSASRLSILEYLSIVSSTAYSNFFRRFGSTGAMMRHRPSVVMLSGVSGSIFRRSAYQLPAPGRFRVLSMFLSFKHVYTM
jgi:hypothetical protein